MLLRVRVVEAVGKLTLGLWQTCRLMDVIRYLYVRAELIVSHHHPRAAVP